MTDRPVPPHLSDVPPVVAAWVRTLLDPHTLALVRAAGEGQIEVRLTASKGRVRRRPMVVLNGGPQEMDPAA